MQPPALTHCPLSSVLCPPILRPAPAIRPALPPACRPLPRLAALLHRGEMFETIKPDLPALLLHGLDLPGQPEPLLHLRRLHLLDDLLLVLCRGRTGVERHWKCGERSTKGSGKDDRCSPNAAARATALSSRARCFSRSRSFSSTSLVSTAASCELLCSANPMPSACCRWNGCGGAPRRRTLRRLKAGDKAGQRVGRKCRTTSVARQVSRGGSCARRTLASKAILYAAKRSCRT